MMTPQQLSLPQGCPPHFLRAKIATANRKGNERTPPGKLCRNPPEEENDDAERTGRELESPAHRKIERESEAGTKAQHGARMNKGRDETSKARPMNTKEKEKRNSITEKRGRSNRTQSAHTSKQNFVSRRGKNRRRKLEKERKPM